MPEIPALSDGEAIVYDERHEKGYSSRIQSYNAEYRNAAIKTSIVISFIIFGIFVRIFMDPTFRSEQLDSWTFPILGAIVIFVLLHLHYTLMKEYRVLMKPVIITDMAVYVPTYKNWKKLYFRNIKKVIWHPRSRTIVFLLEDENVRFEMVDRVNNGEGIIKTLGKYVRIEVKEK